MGLNAGIYSTMLFTGYTGAILYLHSTVYSIHMSMWLGAASSADKWKP